MDVVGLYSSGRIRLVDGRSENEEELTYVWMESGV